MGTVSSYYFVERAICIQQSAVYSFSQAAAALNFCTAIHLDMNFTYSSSQSGNYIYVFIYLEPRVQCIIKTKTMQLAEKEVLDTFSLHVMKVTNDDNRIHILHSSYIIATTYGCILMGWSVSEGLWFDPWLRYLTANCWSKHVYSQLKRHEPDHVG